MSSETQRKTEPVLWRLLEALITNVFLLIAIAIGCVMIAAELVRGLFHSDQ